MRGNTADRERRARPAPPASTPGSPRWSGAADEGALRADVDPDLVSRLLFGMVNSLVEWYRPDGHVPATDLAEAVAADRLRGLQA